LAGSHHTGRRPTRVGTIAARGLPSLLDGRRVAEADIRPAIYVRPKGNGFHVVRNICNEEEYVVADGTGGSTFAPGSVVSVASFSGNPGEFIIGSPPAGFGGSSNYAIQLSARPYVTVPPEPPVLTERGFYRGWAYYGDGSSSVWLACAHYRKRLDPGTLAFVEGEVAIRVAVLSASGITGSLNLASTGYAIDELTNGAGGSEVFRSASTALVAPTQASYLHRVVALAAGGGKVAVVYTKNFNGTTYTADLYTSSGTLVASRTFTGVAYPDTAAYQYLNQNAVVYSSNDDDFYFVDKTAAGTFTFSRRSLTDMSVVASTSINFGATGHVYTGCAARPGASGIRVFRSNSAATSQDYFDLDSSMANPGGAGWVSMAFGTENGYQWDYLGTAGPGGNSTCANGSAFACTGQIQRTPPSNKFGVMKLDASGALVANMNATTMQRTNCPPLFSCGTDEFICINSGTGPNGTLQLRRMLSDGTLA
jgi:hypothetical protein